MRPPKQPDATKEVSKMKSHLMGMVTLACPAAVCLFLVSCARCDDAPATKDSPAADAVRQTVDESAGETPSAAPVIADDDPLLGHWVVVEATGSFAEDNKGLRYEFTRDGRARTRALDVKPSAGARRAEPSPGEVVENIWSWRRTGPDTIEMTHPDSPMIAPVEVTPTGDGMIMSWARGGQVFTLVRPDAGP